MVNNTGRHTNRRKEEVEKKIKFGFLIGIRKMYIELKNRVRKKHASKTPEYNDVYPRMFLPHEDPC